MTIDSIEIYESSEGNISVDVKIFEETVWLSQSQMGELFDRNQRTISEHINNIYNDGELEKNSTYRNFRLVQKEGSRNVVREVEHFNLDMIISIGYRVKSNRGISFRKWATSILKQHMLNGYTVNERRIRQIESSIDELVQSQKLLKEDVKGIKNLLVKLIERPIQIHNHINNNLKLGSNALEEKLILLLDELINSIKEKNLKAEIEKTKKEILIQI